MRSGGAGSVRRKEALIWRKEESPFSSEANPTAFIPMIRMNILPHWTRDSRKRRLQIKEQMSNPAADADKLMTDILRAVSMRYDSFAYDDRDKTKSLLDILTYHEKIEDFDMELTKKVIKHIVIDSGTVSAVLVNDKTIPIKGA